jgi:hypothetical protein
MACRMPLVAITGARLLGVERSDPGSRAKRAADSVTSGAAGMQPCERLVRVPAARARGEVLARVLRLGGRRPVRGQPREPSRVPRTPVAGEVRQQLAVDGGVRALEQARVLAVVIPSAATTSSGVRSSSQRIAQTVRARRSTVSRMCVTISATSRRSTCSLTDGLRSAIMSIPLLPPRRRWRRSRRTRSPGGGARCAAASCAG